ncbi:MAG: glycosyltransferase family 9 protein [Calditrichaeota bacterium]|nr:MAG: glycosyltransferase family 9 protein [Calditrichota bacterium]
MNKSIRKILVIRLSSLGDVILVTPLLRQLRNAYPTSEIDFLVRSDLADVIRYNPHISRLIEFRKDSDFAYLRKIRSRIWERDYDVILDIHRNLRSRLICFGMGISPFHRTKVLKIRKNQFTRFLLVKFKINLYRKLHGRVIRVWEKYIRAAEPMGVKADDGRPEIFIPPESVRAAQRLIESLPEHRNFTAIAPGARHFTKRWPPEYYADLIEKLYSELHMVSILIGGREDIPVVEEIISKVPAGSAIIAAGRYTLLETAAVIRNAELMVTNDSGLMHLATAFDVPVIAIFGSTVEELGFFPNSPLAEVLENKGLYCRPCSHIGRPGCPERHFRCMKDVTPGDVFRKIL